MSNNLVNTWILLGVDHADRQLLVLGLRESTREEALAVAHERHPSGPANAFCMGHSFQETGQEMRAWFRQCGFCSSEAAEAVREVARGMLELFRNGNKEVET